MFLVDVSDLMSELLNPVHTTGLFLYPLKTENLWFLVFLGGIERDQWHEMG